MAAEVAPRETLVVEVGGKRIEVTVPAMSGSLAQRPREPRLPRPVQKRTGGRKANASAGGDTLDFADAGHHRQDRGRERRRSSRG